jgi:putative ATPase
VAAAQALDHVGLPEAQYALAQAATFIATAPKSNRSGLAYWAAAADVGEHGSLPVPMHLRNAPVARMKSHGIGVNYRYPHDYEGADVEQQYLPDRLVGRRYYRPTEQGYERTIGERMAARDDARATARERGRTPKNQTPAPEVNAMGAASRVNRTREENRRKLAETERRDAE